MEINFHGCSELLTDSGTSLRYKILGVSSQHDI